MSRAASWSARDYEYDAREAAQDAARRAGLTLAEWLDDVYGQHAAEIGVNPLDLTDEERAGALADELSRQRSSASRMRRRDRAPEEARRRKRPSPAENEALWRRAERALDDMEEERFSTGALRARSPSRPPAGARSIADAVDEIARRQSDIDAAAPLPSARDARTDALKQELGQLASLVASLRAEGAAPRKEPQRRQTHDRDLLAGQRPGEAEGEARGALRRELASVSGALAGLQRTVTESGARAADVEALRAEMAQIARGLGALAPRDSLARLETSVRDLAERIDDVRRSGAPENFVAPLESVIRDLTRSLGNYSPAESLAALERRLEALSQNVESLARAQVDPEAMARLLAQSLDIRRTFNDALAQRPDTAAIEKRIGDLADRIERVADRGPTRAGLEAIASAVEQIRADMERQSPAQLARSLEARLETLSLKIDESASRDDLGQHFEKLGERLDAMHRDLAERAAPRADDSRRIELALRAVEARLEQQRAAGPVETRDLAAQLSVTLEQAIAAGATPAAIASLEEQVARIAARLDEPTPQPGVDLGRVESMLAEIAERLDRPAPAAAVEQVHEIVRMLLLRFDAATRAGGASDALNGVERRLADVVERLETPDIARLEARINQIAERLEDPRAAGADVAEIKNALARIADRMEAALPDAGDPQALRALEAQIEAIAARLEGAVGGARTDAARLEAMLLDIAARLDRPPVASPALAVSSEGNHQLERLVRTLAEKLEAAGEAGASPQTINALEEQVRRLANRLDANADRPAIASLERSVNEIYAEMERFRATAIASAEAAAREAAAVALAASANTTAAPTGFSEPVRDLLEREIADLRALQSAGDQRTHATLTCVHETLEKVVDRLAMIENDLEPDVLQRFPAPSLSTSPRGREAQDDAPGYKPSVDLNFSPAEPQSDAQARRVPAPPAEPRLPKAGAIETPSRASEPAVPDVGADFLLEPGSGKPKVSVTARKGEPAQPDVAAPPTAGSAAQASAAEAVSEDKPQSAASAQASFIAAVRRAQQAASAAGETAAPSRGDEIIEQARARARAAAAKAAAPETEKATGGLRGFFAARKKHILLGLAGLVLVFGALQVIRSAPDAAPPAQTPAGVSGEQAPEASANPATNPPTTPEAPASGAPASGEPAAGGEKSSMRAPGPLGGPPLAAGASAPLSSAFQTRVDMTPVASLPSSIAKPPPSDPLTLAAGGDVFAQFELGARHADGRHAPQNHAKAAEWFGKAAAQGYAPAQYRLGVIYEKGFGVARDLDRARALYTSAAERGNVRAMHNLGVLLADGGSGRPDYTAAAEWFRRAAEHGVRDSQYNLAILSARGLGVPQDLVQAYVWFSVAANQGDAGAGAKMKEVAARLDARQSVQARALAEAFKPKPGDSAANEPGAPQGGWATQPASAGARAPKISSL